ncbi:MAG: hypothetical protein ACPHJ3_13935 [Rubripirellula sp.]|jgi:hypothetical protein
MQFLFHVPFSSGGEAEDKSDRGVQTRKHKCTVVAVNEQTVSCDGPAGNGEFKNNAYQCFLNYSQFTMSRLLLAAFCRRKHPDSSSEPNLVELGKATGDAMLLHRRNDAKYAWR